MPKDVLFDETTVLRKATALFSNKGYNGTSMDELTKATGLSRSSIYNTFGDKHELFMKSLRHYLEEEQKSMTEAVQKTGSPLKKIQLAFKYIVEVILADKPRNGCLMVNTTTELANTDKEVCTQAVENMDGMEKQFAEWIKAGQQQGEISTAFTPQAMARFLFNAYSGIRVTGKSKPDRKVLEDIVKVNLAVLQPPA
jgi:TetR/AcrR family transcriptional repressor of nem operon